MTAPTVTDTVEAAVLGHRFFYGDERGLQEGIHEALLTAGLDVYREVSLNPRGRIDFLILTPTRVGVEVKVKSSSVSVTRQLQRYAPHVDELVLVTTRATHRDVPRVIGGKPVRIVFIRGAAW